MGKLVGFCGREHYVYLGIVRIHVFAESDVPKSWLKIKSCLTPILGSNMAQNPPRPLSASQRKLMGRRGYCGLK
jgi:hypothetical protein